MANLCNLVSNIKNNQLVKTPVIIFQNNLIFEKFLKIFWDIGLIIGYKIIKDNKLKIFLKYKKNKPVIHSVKIISKSNNKVYYSTKQLWKINYDQSLYIFSTNKGLKSLLECKKQNIGGKLFLIVN